MAVGDTKAFDGAVEGEDIGEMAVVEPEAGGGDKNSPIRGVGCGGVEGIKQSEEGQGEGKEGIELHSRWRKGLSRCVDRAAESMRPEAQLQYMLSIAIE